jgi:hypothetical protein
MNKHPSPIHLSRPRALALAGVFALAAGWLSAQPTDNPVATQYGPGNYPTWVDDLAWANVIDMSTYANGAGNFEKFENARDELHAAGGGVLYYPAGSYTFNLPDAGYGPGIGPMSRGLMLKSGVVIRGADLAPGADQAVVRTSGDPANAGFYNDVTHNLDPQTVFVFPTQTRGTDPVTSNADSAGEVPRDWSLIGMTVGTGESTLADVNNIGVVNVTIEGGVIFWGYHTPRAATRNAGKWLSTFKTDWPAGAPLAETWGGSAADGTHYMDAINGSTGWHTEVTAGSGRLVSGVVLKNSAPFNDMITLDRKASSSSANAPSDFAHYRFTGRIAAHGADIFIANNVMAKPTRNFVHEMLQNAGVRTVLFDYANHIGIDVNKSNYGGNQDNVSVVTEGTGYYLPNVIIRDNWVFSRGNKGFEISGQYVTIQNNHNERYYTANIFPYDYITNPGAYPAATPASGIDAEGISFDGWTWQSSETASDYMSRGYDLGGNNLWADRNSVINTGSRGNDGEGIMGQRHNNIETFSWAFTYNVQNQVNKGPGTFGEPGWIGIYDMHAGGFLSLHNATNGTHGILKAESNWILDATVTPNAGAGSTATPDTLHAAGTDYQVIHSGAVNAPVNVQAAFINGGKAVEITWEDAATNELGFRVDRRLAGGEWMPVAYRPAQSLGKGSGVTYTKSDPDWVYPNINPEKWVDYTVAEGTSVDYRVVAINADDDASTGVSDVVSLGAPPSLIVPVGVGVGMSGADVQLTFNSESGQNYQILVSSDGMLNWAPVGTPTPGTGGPMTLSHSGGKPAAGGKVFYKVEVTE